MHFKINKNLLVNAINNVSKAVSIKTTIQILTGIKFELSSKGLTLTGSDSDISIKMFLPYKEDDNSIQIYQEGQLVLPKNIIEIVKKLPEDEIEFKIVDKLSVIIKSGSSEFRLNGFDAEEFPIISSFDDNKVFNIQSDLLKTMIKQTIFAVSTIESRPILTGVLWQLNNSSLRFVATDSHRLAMRESNVNNPMNLSFNNIVVPGKSLSELNKILPENSSDIKIKITENQFLVKSGNLLYISRLLDGTYPDISRIIPEKGSTNITIKTKDFLDSIERASLIAKDSKNNVIKLLLLDKNTLEISSNSPEVGKVNEKININSFVGEEIKISFNSKYTLEALKALDSQEIIIEFTGGLSPFVIKPLDNDNILHLILPVRT